MPRKVTLLTNTKQGLINPTGTTPCIPELGSATEIAPHAFADATLSQIRAWLKECQSSHLKCPRLCIAPPRRLVDVGMPTPPSGTRKIRLVEDYLEPVKYIALSHCWGTDQPFTTTKSTLKMRLNEIAWNDLPKTYSDAVLVARKLHIRYIWIDSLCIIQDDKYIDPKIISFYAFADTSQRRLGH